MFTLHRILTIHNGLTNADAYRDSLQPHIDCKIQGRRWRGDARWIPYPERPNGSRCRELGRGMSLGRPYHQGGNRAGTKRVPSARCYKDDVRLSVLSLGRSGLGYLRLRVGCCFSTKLTPLVRLFPSFFSRFEYHHDVIKGEEEMWNMLFLNCPRSLVSFKVPLIIIIMMSARSILMYIALETNRY